MSAGRLTLDGVACLRGDRLLFEEVELALEPGEAALVTGPNGAGKSSLLRLIAGLLPAAAGRVRAEGGIALADERLALDVERPLVRALGFWARLDQGDAARGMAAMGLGRLSEVPVRLLSTGQRQRAALARVIASGAAIWLLDEPANGLDANALDLLRAAMAGHRAGGGIVVAASHVAIGLDDARAVRL